LLDEGKTDCLTIDFGLGVVVQDIVDWDTLLGSDIGGGAGGFDVIAGPLAGSSVVGGLVVGEGFHAAVACLASAIILGSDGR